MRPGKGKISRRGYFSLLASAFYQYNWLFSPPSLISQVKIARRWELWRWGHPGLDILFQPTKWMDGQLAILRCFFYIYIIPVISGRWEEDNIKLYAREPLLDLYKYFMYQVRRR